MRIALDPGHGGKNVGCQYPPLSEKDYVLGFCKKLKVALDTAGHPTILTRSIDEAVGFTKRAFRAHASAAEAALVVHVNAALNTSAHGLITYYMPANERGKALAAAIMSNAPAALRRKSQAPEAATLDGHGDDATIRHYSIPVTLIELGFASNPADKEYLLSEEGSSELVKSIVQSVTQYEKGLSKP